MLLPKAFYPVLFRTLTLTQSPDESPLTPDRPRGHGDDGGKSSHPRSGPKGRTRAWTREGVGAGTHSEIRSTYHLPSERTVHPPRSYGVYGSIEYGSTTVRPDRRDRTVTLTRPSGALRRGTRW